MQKNLRDKTVKYKRNIQEIPPYNRCYAILYTSGTKKQNRLYIASIICFSKTIKYKIYKNKTIKYKRNA